MLLKRFLEFLGGNRGRQTVPGIRSEGEWVHLSVRCDSCGEIIQVRLSRRNEIQRNYDGDGSDQQFFVRKVLMGNDCFKRIPLEIDFDRNYRPTRVELSGGKLVDPGSVDT